MDRAVLDDQAVDRARAQVVRALGVVAVAADLGVVDRQADRRAVVRVDRLVVAVEQAVVDRHGAGVDADAARVTVVVMGTRELEVGQRHVRVDVQQVGKIVEARRLREVRDAAHALDDDLVVHRAEVVDVGPGRHIDGVAVLRRRQRRRQRGERLASAHDQHPARGRDGATRARVDQVHARRHHNAGRRGWRDAHSATGTGIGSRRSGGEVKRGPGGQGRILAFRHRPDVSPRVAEQGVVRHRRGVRRGVVDRDAVLVVADEGVACHGQAGARIRRALAAEMDGGVVLAVGTLLDDVVRDVVHAAVRQVDAVARIPAVVENAVALDHVLQRPAFHLMPHDRVVHVAVEQRERGDGADIHVVGVAVAGTVGAELGVFHEDRAVRVRVGQQPVLVAPEHAVVHHQLAGLVADARPVVVAHRGARKAEPVDRRVGIDGRDCLAVRRRDGRDVINGAAYGLQGDLMADDEEVVRICAGLHQHSIPILGGSNCIRDGFVRTVSADIQCGHVISTPVKDEQ